MFAKLSLLALALPIVSALTFATPKDVVSGKEATFTWTSSDEDIPTFRLGLIYPDVDRIDVLAENVQTSANRITVKVPDAQAGDGYALGEYIPSTRIPYLITSSEEFSIEDDE